MRITGLAFVAFAFAGCGDKPSGSTGSQANTDPAAAPHRNTANFQKSSSEGDHPIPEAPEFRQTPRQTDTSSAAAVHGNTANLATSVAAVGFEGSRTSSFRHQKESDRISEESISAKMERIEILTAAEVELARRFLMDHSEASQSQIDELLDIYQYLSMAKSSGTLDTPEAMQKAERLKALAHM